MGVNTQKFIRKPLFVDAVRVTAQNFDEIAAWCQGEILTEELEGTGTTKKFIKVRVHNPKNPRQTKAFIGDWILYTERGYKVYTNKAFRGAFDLVQTDETPELPTAPAVLDEHATPQGEPHEYVEATPEAIAETVDEQQPVEAPGEGVVESLTEIEEFVEGAIEDKPEPAARVEETPSPEPVSEQPPEDAAAGKYVISEQEQRELGPDGVRELVSTGDAILAQDLAETA